jgi:hypothetical protein
MENNGRELYSEVRFASFVLTLSRLSSNSREGSRWGWFGCRLAAGAVVIEWREDVVGIFHSGSVKANSYGGGGIELGVIGGVGSGIGLQV